MTLKNELPSWEWWLDIALQQSTCVYTYHVHTRALTSRLRPLYVTGYSTEAVVTYRSDIHCHFPSPVFSMYLINLSITTFYRWYYSGALSKAVTKHSGLLRFDVALLLKRCETFRTNAPSTHRIHIQWRKILEYRCFRCQNSTDRNSRFTPLSNRHNVPCSEILGRRGLGGGVQRC